MPESTNIISFTYLLLNYQLLKNMNRAVPTITVEIDHRVDQVKHNYQSIKTKKEKLKKIREMINDELTEYDEYRDLMEQKREIAKKLTEQKTKIFNQRADLVQQQEEVKEIREEIKAEQLTLSYYLFDLAKEGKTQVEVEGEKKEIEKSLKIK